MKLDDLIVIDKFGNDFTFNKEDDCILEIHYCTSYYQFVVQQKLIDDKGEHYFIKKDLIHTHDNYENPIDLLCVNDEDLCEIKFKED